MFQRSRVTAVVGGPNNGVPYDFRYWAPQLLGRSIWQSVSDCGLAGASTIAPTRSTSRPRRSRAPASSRRRRPAAQACSSTTSTPTCRTRAATLFPGSANALGLLASQTSVATDPSTGNVLIRETENLLRCSPDAGHRAGDGADLLVVRLGGRQARPRDHPAGRRPPGARDRHLVGDRRAPPPDRRLLRGSPRRQRAGRLVPVGRRLHLLPARASRRSRPRRRRSASSRARPPSAADGDVNNAQGAITLQDRPTTLRFRTAPRIWTQYVRTLTPETPTRISIGFSWATAQVDLDDADRAGRARARADALPRPEPRRQDAHRLQAPAAGRALQGRQGQVRDLARCAARTASSSRAAGPRPRSTGGSSVALLVSSRLIGKSK